jgi:hypothetical protein
VDTQLCMWSALKPFIPSSMCEASTQTSISSFRGATSKKRDVGCNARNWQTNPHLYFISSVWWSRASFLYFWPHIIVQVRQTGILGPHLRISYRHLSAFASLTFTLSAPLASQPKRPVMQTCVPPARNVCGKLHPTVPGRVLPHRLQ